MCCIDFFFFQGLNDFDLLDVLRKVDLEYIVMMSAEDGTLRGRSDDDEECMTASSSCNDFKTVGKRRNWDDVENWMDVLSGGQSMIKYFKISFTL